MDRLSERYLPEHQFSEAHAICIDAQPTAILDVVEHLDPTADPCIARLISLRQLPGRLLGRPAAREPFGLHQFTLLERTDSEIAFGLVGQFWKPDFALETIADGAAFRAFAKPGVPKLVMSFETCRESGGMTRLTTRTRVHCPDRAAWMGIAPYWAVIRIASGFIRRRMLGIVKRAAEATCVAV